MARTHQRPLYVGNVQSPPGGVAMAAVLRGPPYMILSPENYVPRHASARA